MHLKQFIIGKKLKNFILDNMTEQKFKLEINATSEDGVAINQNTRAHISCSASMAIGIMVHTLKTNSDLREIILSATEAYLEEVAEEKIKMN